MFEVIITGFAIKADVAECSVKDATDLKEKFTSPFRYTDGRTGLHVEKKSLQYTSL
jgi:hypothetical protein